MALRRFVCLIASVTLASAAPAFRNTDPAVHYVGSAVCAGCHKTIYNKYKTTGMGRSISRPDPELAAQMATVRNEVLHREFRVFERNGNLYQSESELRDGKTVFEVVHKLEYAIGSGANGISFAVRRGNHLFQAPLSYYTRLAKWDSSPGFAETAEGFGRPLHEGCIVCHAGRAQPVPRGEGLYRDPPLQEMAVGCEKCHGPGELHVKERQAGARATPDTSIVNPARLPFRLAEDICMQCHQRGDTRVLLPGKTYDSFRPGTPLLNTVALLELPRSSESQDLLEHHSSMKSSKCYRASDGKLSCLTCHDPHEQPDSAKAPAYFASKCLGCHTKQSCPKVLEARAGERSTQCVNCHMQKRDVKQISHSALTDHRILIAPNSPPDIVSARPSELPGLILLNSAASDAALPLVTRLAAYGELQDRAPHLRQLYLSLLAEASSAIPEDPLVLAALGRKALLENSPEAVELLQKSEQTGIPGSATYIDLSEALGRANREKEAVGALERGQAAYPFSSQIRKHLILRYIRQKDYRRAATAMQEYLELFPEDSFMRGLLSQVPAEATQQP
jgi:hypothetical protein